MNKLIYFMNKLFILIKLFSYKKKININSNLEFLNE